MTPPEETLGTVPPTGEADGADRPPIDRWERHRARRHFGPRPRRRPNWWPETEPWPPQGPPAWVRNGEVPPWAAALREHRRARHGFARRFGCLLLLLALFVSGLLLLAVGAFVSFVAGTATHPALVVLGLMVFLAISAGVFGALRAAHRTAAPVDDLIEAAGRIEVGDYSARVPERGNGDVRSLARAFNDMSARLEDIDSRRRTFLADVAHELRTPLTVIQGQLEAIGDGVYPVDQEHLAPVLGQVHALEQLVDDVRLVALAEAGVLVLEREDVDPGALVDDVLAAYRATADAGKVALIADIEPGLPAIPADPGRIRRAIGNLVANAIRYTPPGGSVTVAARASPARDAVAVEVRDTGSGIPPELLPRVFDRFVKEPGSPGSGLGLAIAKDVVTAHGGTITAETPAGNGTTVRFTLPLRGGS